MRKILVAAVALCALLGGSATKAHASAAPCGGPTSDYCGVLVVPLDPTGAVPGTLSLRYRVRLATGQARRGVVVALAGGPGQSAVPHPSYRRVLGENMPGFDVVTLDTRGTGAGALNCPALHDADADEQDAILRCADELGPTRALYGSREVANDLEVLRKELGVERIVVAGVSYGTLQAQAYAELFPRSVQALVLDSVVDGAANDGSDRPSLAATARILRELCSGKRCTGVTKDAVADVARLQSRIERRPLRGRVVMPSGRIVPHSLGGSSDVGALLHLLLDGDFSSTTRELFPAAVRAALEGDPVPLLRLDAYRALGSGPEVEDISDSVFLATTCRDLRAPWALGAVVTDRFRALDALIETAPAPAPWTSAVARTNARGALCTSWPDAPSPVGGGPLPDVPTLILSGRQDVRTPLEEARGLLTRLPRATLVSVPDAGHSLLSNDRCAARALRSFARSFGTLTTRCARDPFVRVSRTPSPHAGAINAEAGSPAARAAVLARAFDALATARQTVWALGVYAGNSYAAGGLRSGVVRYDPDTRTFRFRHYTDSSGFTLDGIATNTSLQLRFSGRSAGSITASDTDDLAVEFDPS